MAATARAGIPAGHEQLATARSESLFAGDMAAHGEQLRDSLAGARVAVVGASGSVGGAVVKQLVGFDLAALTLFDLSENNLVELVRDLQSTDGLRLPAEFAALPIGIGGREFTRFFADARPYDYLFNLSALKHVRSEKDVYSLSRMLDTNVLLVHEFLAALPYRLRNFFSVSSDKAVRPANLMGASKMVMERILLANAERQPFSTARFANVAFSDGSLLHGFLRRIEKRQPLVAPTDVRRYFISHQEAGELCLLAGVLAASGEVFVPRLTDAVHATSFAGIAVALLESLGLEPVELASGEEAKARAEELIAERRYPCVFAASDTTGEKALEEFVAEGEDADFTRFANIGVIAQQLAPADAERVREFLEFAYAARETTLAKDAYVQALRRVIPDLEHVERGKSLDEKM